MDQKIRKNMGIIIDLIVVLVIPIQGCKEYYNLSCGEFKTTPQSMPLKCV